MFSSSVISNSLQSHQAPLFMEISRQDHWIGWPFPTPIVMHENIQFSKHHLSERTFSSIAWSWNPYENHLATEVRISGLSLTPLVSMSVPKPAPHWFLYFYNVFKLGSESSKFFYFKIIFICPQSFKIPYISFKTAIGFGKDCTDSVLYCFG